VTREDKGATEIDDQEKIPPYVKKIMESDRKGLTGFICSDCRPLFHHGKIKGNENILKYHGSLCGVCGDKLGRADTPKKKNSNSPCDGIAEEDLRRYGAHGDRCHKSCYDLARKQEPQQTEEESRPALQLEIGTIDTGRDKSTPLSKAEEQCLSFWLSCKRAQGVKTVRLKSYKANGGGRTSTIQFVAESTGNSDSTKYRNKRTLVEAAKTVTKRNKHTTTTELIADTALHTSEGKKARLVSPENQKPVSLEAIQSSIRGSHAKTEKFVTEFKRAKVRYDITLRELASRRKKRRLPMEFSVDKVLHPECGSSASQAVYTKRSVDMCNIAAQRHSMLMSSPSFVELPDIKLGGKDALYCTLAVCARVLVKIKKKKQNQPHHHRACLRVLFFCSTMRVVAITRRYCSRETYEPRPAYHGQPWLDICMLATTLRVPS
jgi:hypothetical protein